MADMHILAGDGQRWMVIMHFAVPDQTNAVGNSYRTALVASGIGGTSQMEVGAGLGQIEQSEMDDIQAGLLYEYPFACAAESGASTNAEMLALIRAEYARLEDPVLAELQDRLRYYGYTAAKE